jgi:hypothetical protein
VTEYGSVVASRKQVQFSFALARSDGMGEFREAVGSRFHWSTLAQLMRLIHRLTCRSVVQ